MEIRETKDRGIELVWTFKGVNKSRRFQGRGKTRMSHGTTITIPTELANLISNDGMYTYMYEHFDKVVLTPDEPDDDIVYKKIRLNNSSYNENGNKRFEISNKFLDTSTMKYAVLTYNPKREDYLTHKKGVVTIDVCGENPRKHIRRMVDLDEHTVSYELYTHQTNATQDIQFHNDLKNLIPNLIYVYECNGEICLTNEQPPVECIQANEQDLQDLLLYHKIIDKDTEWIEYKIWLNENDYCDNSKAKITLIPH